MVNAVTLRAQNGGVDACIDEDLGRHWHAVCDSFILVVGLPVLSVKPLIRITVPAGNCFIRTAACSKKALLSDESSALLVAK